MYDQAYSLFPKIDYREEWVPRFTGKTQITGKTAEIPERPPKY